jgi:hypothetical protein
MEEAFSDALGPRGFHAMLRHCEHVLDGVELADDGLSTLTAFYELSCELIGSDLTSALFASAAASPPRPRMAKCS